MKLANRGFSILMVLTLCMTMLLGCEKTSGNSIQLTQDTCSILEGESVQIVAMTDEEGTVSWSSSDESVASVTDGTIFGKKEGKTTVTAKQGNAKAECVVTVGGDNTESVYLASKVDGYYMEMDAQEGVQTEFVVCTRDEEGNVTEQEATDLTYKMYNRGIATIDENGVITPLEAGPTTMTVTSGDLSCTVDVVVSTKLIETPKDWLEVLKITDNLDAYYYVTEDLDFEGIEYTGIGTTIEKEQAKCFRGTIDGGNRTIKNITLKCSGGYRGIFGPLLDAKISNLSFENVVLTASGSVANGCGLAPSITGHGIAFRNVSLDLQYQKKASGNSSVLAAEIEGSGIFEKCLIQVSSPSENTARDGIKIAGSCDANAQMKNLVVVCEGTAPAQVPDGVNIFTDKMEAIWKLNSEKNLGSAWSYSATELPKLSK